MIRLKFLHPDYVEGQRLYLPDEDEELEENEDNPHNNLHTCMGLNVSTWVIGNDPLTRTLLERREREQERRMGWPTLLGCSKHAWSATLYLPYIITL